MTDTETWQQAAGKISRLVPDDKEFILAIYRRVQMRVPWRAINSWTIHDPDRSWQDRYGDCSEQAVLTQAMILHARPHLDVRQVWGVCPGRGRHDTLEVHLNKYVWYIDAAYQPGFVKIGDGLVPGERVVD